MEMALEAANANVDSDVRYELRYSLRSAFEDVFSYIDKLEARVATLEAQITRTAPIMKPAALTAPQPAAPPSLKPCAGVSGLHKLTDCGGDGAGDWPPMSRRYAMNTAGPSSQT